MLALEPISRLPLVQPGDDIAHLIIKAVAEADLKIQARDILVIAQKVVSRAEGRLVSLNEISPSQRAKELAESAKKDPRLVELILRESREILRVRPGLIVVEDGRGFICANAGIDRSNVPQTDESETVSLLPADPNASAAQIRERLYSLVGIRPGVIINDSHGRAFREGTVGVAIGIAGVSALSDRRGETDLTGYKLEHTIIGTADEIAAAASLVMGAAGEGVPAVLVRGLDVHVDEQASARELQRPQELDLFR